MSASMPPRAKEVRRLAQEVASRYPGKWFWLAEDFEEDERLDVGNVWHETQPGRASAVVHDTSRIAAEYLEAVQPSVILELIAEIERLQDHERRHPCVMAACDPTAG